MATNRGRTAELLDNAFGFGGDCVGKQATADDGVFVRQYDMGMEKRSGSRRGEQAPAGNDLHGALFRAGDVNLLTRVKGAYGQPCDATGYRHAGRGDLFLHPQRGDGLDQVLIAG